MKKIFLPRFFILFFFLFSGCVRSVGVSPPPLARGPLPPSLYDTVPSGKNLRVIREFFLVDDFNAREAKNRLGAPWQIEGSPEGGLEVEFVPQDALHQRRGSSLGLQGALPAGGRSVFKSSLKGLDLSQAEAVVLSCQVEGEGEKPFSGKLELLLKDLRARTQIFDFTSVCFSGRPRWNGWREVIVKRAQLRAIDWEELDEIALILRAGPEPLRARIGIDEIAFYGRGDVGFRSEKDNLIGFPSRAEAPDRAKALLAEEESEEFLYEIARDTWKYFENALDRNTQLPVDHLRVSEPRDVGSYTTPTNLAMYFLACVAARELGLISKKEAIRRIQKTLETLRVTKRWQGFHYNFYHTGNLQVTREYVSVVDAGWLAAAWVVLRQAFPKELGGLVTRFLDEIDFYEFYDPSIRQLRLGFDEATGSFSPYHYGLIATEARVASFVGIGKGDLPREHWWLIYRTPPKSWTWQSQVPEGKEVEIEGVPVFEGYYTYQGKKFVPSWGGSLFEFLMPSLVLKERELAPEGLGRNNRAATEIHIDYALNRQGYPVWGISPASTSSGQVWRYGEYGVKYLGVKGYRDEGVIAPYATFLALDTLAEHAIDNLRRLVKLYPIYGEYGFYDSVNVRSGRVNTQYLALDQGMTLVAIANYLRKGVIQDYFHRDEAGRRAETLLSEEQFFS